MVVKLGMYYVSDSMMNLRVVMLLFTADVCRLRTVSCERLLKDVQCQPLSSFCCSVCLPSVDLHLGR